MSGIEHNAHQVARRRLGVAVAIRQELVAESKSLAEQVAAVMRREAPKFRSTTANSVRVDRESQLSFFIGPHTDYAKWRNAGRKPGKGLPRFFDPAAAAIVAWLQSRIGAIGSAGPSNPKWQTARKGSKRRTAAELELRDRYMAFSRHVRLHGLKADPFVARTAAQFRQAVPNALVAAVQRGIQRARQGGAA